MAYFEWTTDYIVGHPEIDDQHKRMVLLAEAVVESLINSDEHQPGAAQLQALIDVAQEHFGFEEGLMRLANYPDAEEHAKYHASLLTELRTYCDKVLSGENTKPVGLISFLWDWLVQHIRSADRGLGVWLGSRDPNLRLP
jgi:hemerythrin